MMYFQTWLSYNLYKRKYIYLLAHQTALLILDIVILRTFEMKCGIWEDLFVKVNVSELSRSKVTKVDANAFVWLNQVACSMHHKSYFMDLANENQTTLSTAT